MEEVLKVVHPRTGGFASTYWYLSSVAATVECRAGWVEIFPTWSVGLVRGSVAVGGLSSLPSWACIHYYYCYLCYWTGPMGHTVMLKGAKALLLYSEKGFGPLCTVIWIGLRPNGLELIWALDGFLYALSFPNSPLPLPSLQVSPSWWTWSWAGFRVAMKIDCRI